MKRIKPVDRDEFYHSPKWKSLRDSILREDKYMCTRCKERGQMVQAEHVHHIFPREQFTEYQYCRWNLTSLCFKCHNEMHNRFNGDLSKAGRILMQKTALMNNIPLNTKRTILVIGLRGTGKSYYVRTHLDDRSIAYDMDAIASAFRLKQPHEEYFKPARKMANDFLSGFMAKAHDYADNVYVIRTAPTIRELNQLDPDMVVICKTERVFREMDDRASALDRIREVETFCRSNSIDVVVE